MNIELVCIGFVIGAFIGISGVGGGSIMTPVLILVLGVNPLVAVGTDLLYSVPTKILGAVMHARQQTIDWKIVRALLYGGLPGVVAGVLVLMTLRHYMDFTTVAAIVKHAVGIALFVSACALLYSLLPGKMNPASEGAVREITPQTFRLISFAGASIGFFVALTSIGSGSMTLPVLLLLAPFVGIRRLIGTDIVFAAVLIPVAAAGHATLKDINLSVAFNLLIGSLPGVYAGTKLCSKLPEIWLRPAVSVVLIIAGSRLL